MWFLKNDISGNNKRKLACFVIRLFTSSTMVDLLPPLHFLFMKCEFVCLCGRACMCLCVCVGVCVHACVCIRCILSLSLSVMPSTMRCKARACSAGIWGSSLVPLSWYWFYTDVRKRGDGHVIHFLYSLHSVSFPSPVDL